MEYYHKKRVKHVCEDNVMRVTTDSYGNQTMCNTEYVCDIVGSTLFENNTFYISPSNRSLFPVLSQLCNNYALYQMENFTVKYNAIQNRLCDTSLQLGTVTITFQTNSGTAVYSDKMSMYDDNTSITNSVLKSFDNTMLCDRKELFVAVNGLWPSSEDSKSYTYGILNVATNNCFNNVTCGELFVSYKIKFKRLHLVNYQLQNQMVLSLRVLKIHNSDVASEDNISVVVVSNNMFNNVLLQRFYIDNSYRCPLNTMRIMMYNSGQRLRIRFPDNMKSIIIRFAWFPDSSYLSDPLITLYSSNVTLVYLGPVMQNITDLTYNCSFIVKIGQSAIDSGLVASGGTWVTFAINSILMNNSLFIQSCNSEFYNLN